MSRRHNRSKYLPVITTLVCVMLLTFIGKVEAAPISQNYFTVTLPATALLKTIQPLLPLEFTHSHSSLQGKLQIDSIDNITISKRGISLSGIISGKDMSVNTTIGGQDLNLKMGKLTMPASCDLHLRFDQRKKHLFVTPHFRQAQDTENTGNGGSNDLLNMLSDIVGKEYLLDTNQFLSFKPVINGQNRSIHLEPVDIWTKDDRLIIKLQPVEKNQTQ